MIGCESSRKEGDVDVQSGIGMISLLITELVSSSKEKAVLIDRGEREIVTGGEEFDLCFSRKRLKR